MISGKTRNNTISCPLFQPFPLKQLWKCVVDYYFSRSIFIISFIVFPSGTKLFSYITHRCVWAATNKSIICNYLLRSLVDLAININMNCAIHVAWQKVMVNMFNLVAFSSHLYCTNKEHRMVSYIYHDYLSELSEKVYPHICLQS